VNAGRFCSQCGALSPIGAHFLQHVRAGRCDCLRAAWSVDWGAFSAFCHGCTSHTPYSEGPCGSGRKLPGQPAFWGAGSFLAADFSCAHCLFQTLLPEWGDLILILKYLSAITGGRMRSLGHLHIFPALGVERQENRPPIITSLRLK